MKTADAKRCAETCAFFGVRRLSRLLERHYSRILAPAGLTASQFSILIAVAVSEELSITALAETIDMSQSAMSRQLAAMERRGWIETAGVTGRAQRLRLTAKGEGVLSRGLARWRIAQGEVVATLGPRAWNRFMGDLRRLAARPRGDRDRAARAR